MKVKDLKVDKIDKIILNRNNPYLKKENDKNNNKHEENNNKDKYNNLKKIVDGKSKKNDNKLILMFAMFLIKEGLSIKEVSEISELSIEEIINFIHNDLKIYNINDYYEITAIIREREYNYQKRK